MSVDAAPGRRPERPLRARRAAEAATYVGVVVVGSVVVASTVGVVLASSYGCGWLRGLVLGKTILFFGGFGLAAYGAVRLQPEVGSRTGTNSGRSSGLLGFGMGALGMGGGDGADDEPQNEGVVGWSDDGSDETGFTRLVMSIPPARLVAIRPADRLAGGTKILLSGVVLLGLTAVMEFGLGLYAVPC